MPRVPASRFLYSAAVNNDCPRQLLETFGSILPRCRLHDLHDRDFTTLADSGLKDDSAAAYSALTSSLYAAGIATSSYLAVDSLGG